MLRGLAGGDGDGGSLRREAGEKDADAGGAGGDVGETVLAGLVGERFLRSALEGDAGAFEVFGAGGIVDASLDGAGGGSLRGERGGEDERGGGAHEAVRKAVKRRGKLHGRGRWKAAPGGESGRTRRGRRGSSRVVKGRCRRAANAVNFSSTPRPKRARVVGSMEINVQRGGSVNFFAAQDCGSPGGGGGGQAGDHFDEDFFPADEADGSVGGGRRIFFHRGRGGMGGHLKIMG